MLAFSTQVRGFKPGHSRRIFKGEKILSTPSFRGEVQPLVPCRRFAACKRSLNVAWKSTFRQNYQTNLAHRVTPFAARGLALCRRGGSTWRQKWERLNCGGDPGLHNKPLGCSASGVYASGHACEEEENCSNMFRFTRKPSSGGHSQFLAKITHLVKSGYVEAIQDVSVMAAYCDL